MGVSLHLNTDTSYKTLTRHLPFSRAHTRARARAREASAITLDSTSVIALVGICVHLLSGVARLCFTCTSGMSRKKIATTAI